MAEYWQSLPRKFCDICKCWFADNKASIQFHERGKRHQENAAKRIHDIQKRGIKQAKKEKELEDDMAKIEQAALAAYKKDLAKMDGSIESYVDLSPSIPTVTSKSVNIKEPKAKNVKKSLDIVQKKIEENLKSMKVPSSETELSPTESESETTTVWYEAVTEEGHKYYWNNQTSESRWEPPEEGFVSIEEQNQMSDSSSNTAQKEEEKAESPAADKPVPCSIGPSPRVDPYGSWVTIEKQEPVEYDLQLPEKSQDVVEVVIPLHKEENPSKFKEKVVGKITEDGEAGEVTFKKRKVAGSFRKNARQRTDDD